MTGPAAETHVTGSDVEAAADATEDAAILLADRLAALAQAPLPHSLDSRAVLQGMARACEPMSRAAAELARQGWVDLDDVDQADRARWADALAALEGVAGLFEEIADGWI